MFRKICALFTFFCFILSNFGYIPAHADEINLPAPGHMVGLSPAFEPALIKAITVHPENPFLFNFIMDTGNSHLQGNALKSEGDRLVKYFFACLTIPEKDVWVNLSPYEKNRIAGDSLGQTALGRDLLAQDYILKQLTASLIYPEKDLGKEFWDRVYAKAQSQFGTTHIPVNTFNKVWIVADKAHVYQHNNTAYVIGGHLKVFLEEDYLALRNHDITSQNVKSASSVSSQIIRDVILPEIEKEVNGGKNFAALRQIFNSLILATWYKKALKDAVLTQFYADKSKVKGVNLNDPSIKEKIYEQYVQAYKKGVFNYIKEDASHERVPKKYFSGGFESHLQLTIDQQMAAEPKPIGQNVQLDVVAQVDDGFVGAATPKFENTDPENQFPHLQDALNKENDSMPSSEPYNVATQEAGGTYQAPSTPIFDDGTDNSMMSTYNGKIDPSIEAHPEVFNGAKYLPEGSLFIGDNLTQKHLTQVTHINVQFATHAEDPKAHGQAIAKIFEFLNAYKNTHHFVTGQRLVIPVDASDALLIPDAYLKYHTVQPGNAFSSHELALAQRVSEQIPSFSRRKRFMDHMEQRIQIFNAVRRLDVGTQLLPAHFQKNPSLTEIRTVLRSLNMIDGSDHLTAPLSQRYEIWTTALNDTEFGTRLTRADIEAVSKEMVINPNFLDVDTLLRYTLGVNPVYKIVSGNLKNLMETDHIKKQMYAHDIEISEILAPSLVSDQAMQGASDFKPGDYVLYHGRIVGRILKKQEPQQYLLEILPYRNWVPAQNISKLEEGTRIETKDKKVALTILSWKNNQFKVSLEMGSLKKEGYVLRSVLGIYLHSIFANDTYSNKVLTAFYKEHIHLQPLSVVEEASSIISLAGLNTEAQEGGDALKWSKEDIFELGLSLEEFEEFLIAFSREIKLNAAFIRTSKEIVLRGVAKRPDIIAQWLIFIAMNSRIFDRNIRDRSMISQEQVEAIRFNLLKKPLILLNEDEEMLIRTLIKKMEKAPQLRLIVSKNIEEARRNYAQYGSEAGLVITDVDIPLKASEEPKEFGVAFARQVIAEHPKTPIIVTSMRHVTVPQGAIYEYKMSMIAYVFNSIITGADLPEINLGSAFGVQPLQPPSKPNKPTVSSDDLKLSDKPHGLKDNMAKAEAPGGIDLNTKDLSMLIQTDRNGTLHFKVDPIMLDRIKHNGIKTLSPVIVNVRPLRQAKD